MALLNPFLLGLVFRQSLFVAFLEFISCLSLSNIGITGVRHIASSHSFTIMPYFPLGYQYAKLTTLLNDITL